jgi:hypothetical protein
VVNIPWQHLTKDLALFRCFLYFSVGSTSNYLYAKPCGLRMFKGTNQNTAKTEKKIATWTTDSVKNNMSLVPGAQLTKKLVATNLSHGTKSKKSRLWSVGFDTAHDIIEHIWAWTSTMGMKIQLQPVQIGWYPTTQASSKEYTLYILNLLETNRDKRGTHIFILTWSTASITLCLICVWSVFDLTKNSEASCTHVMQP